MKTLIAITTCHAYRDRAQACRDTWVKDVDTEKFDVRFFLGIPPDNGTVCPKKDEVILNVPDTYNHFTQKVQAMRNWAWQQGYELVWKADDDVYIRPERIPDIVGDYIGRERGSSGKYPAPYCSGFFYRMSRRAIEKIKDMPVLPGDDTFEDRWTGNALLKVRIRPENVPGITVHFSKRNAICGREAPRFNNQIIASCEYDATRMHRIHADFINQVPSNPGRGIRHAGALRDVTVMIKTFLRDGYLLGTLGGLKRNFPDMPIIVVDDGYNTATKVKAYAELREKGDSVAWMPFDSGFGEKANAAIPLCKTEYMLIASDDFDFSTPKVREGVMKMKLVLDAEPEIGVASGRVDGRPYESCLEIADGRVIEHAGHRETRKLDDITYHMCDLTVNYSLVRQKVFDSVRWDGGEVKIGGGEHGAFFLDVMSAGWKTCVVEGAEIGEFKFNPTWEAKDYRMKRNRARQPGRVCLVNRGIREWVCQDGRVEIC